MLLDLAPLPLLTVVAILAGTALVSCVAGSRLAYLADVLAASGEGNASVAPNDRSGS